jgi:hypothetical protein
MLSACGVVGVDRPPQPLNDAAEATAVALQLTPLDEPISVLEVRQGSAGRLYTGPRGMVAPTDVEREQAKQARPAWLVVVTGQESGEPRRHELVLDAETGELLYEVLSGLESGEVAMDPG